MQSDNNWNPHLDIEKLEKPVQDKMITNISIDSEAKGLIITTSLLFLLTLTLQVFILVPFVLFNCARIYSLAKPKQLSLIPLYQVESKVKGEKICLYLKQYIPLHDIGKYEVSVVKQQIFHAIEQEIEIFETATIWKEEAKLLEQAKLLES